MKSTKFQVGGLITLVDERNYDGRFTKFYGINNNKEFIPTVANIEDLDCRKYKVLRNHRFLFSGMQTGRDECIRIGLYKFDDPVIVSPAYTTFEIANSDVVLEEYFFMCFLRKEMDRLGWFVSDSSIRSNLDWDRFCEITLNLPPLSVQKKYVEIYNAMLANKRTYRQRLDDLNTAITANIEEFKRNVQFVPLGILLEEIDVRNSDGIISNVKGINLNKEFMPSVANLSKTDLTKYKVLSKNQFAANFMHVMRDKKIPIGLYHSEEPCIISPAYPVFKVKTDNVLEEYIMLWLNRPESDRYAWFISDSSIRGGLEMSRFYEIEIPVPPLPSQKAVVNFYNARYLIQKNISTLDDMLKDICPILIKGSLEEAARS